MIEFVKQPWKTYGAYAYAVYIDGRETAALLLKAQHPGNAFDAPVRFWTLATARPSEPLPDALASLYPADWPTLKAARAAIEKHVRASQ